MPTYKNISGNLVISVLNASDQITLTAPQVNVNGRISATGNITTDAFFFGDGTFISNVTANIGTATKLQNGTSNVDIPTVNGPVTFGINGTGNLMVLTGTGLAVAASTTSTSTVTGALTVAGGAGIVGNVYAGGMFDNGQPVINAISVIDGGIY